MSNHHAAGETGVLPGDDTNFFIRRWKPLLTFVSALALVTVLPIAQLAETVSPLIAVLTVFSMAPAAFLAIQVRNVASEKTPLWLLSASVFLGVVAVGFAYLLSSTFLGYFEMGSFLTMGVLFYLVVAPVEEVFKLGAVYAYPTDTKYFSSAADAAVFGAFVGLGFAGVENAIYFVTEGILEAPIEIFVGRMLVAPVHVIISSIGGYYLGLALLNKERALVFLAKGLVIVVLLHGTHNAVVTYLPAAVALSPLPNGFGFRATNIVFLSTFYCATWYVFRNLLLGDGRRKPGTT